MTAVTPAMARALLMSGPHCGEPDSHSAKAVPGRVGVEVELPALDGWAD